MKKLRYPQVLPVGFLCNSDYSNPGIAEFVLMIKFDKQEQRMRSPKKERAMIKPFFSGVPLGIDVLLY